MILWVDLPPLQRKRQKEAYLARKELEAEEEYIKSQKEV